MYLGLQQVVVFLDGPAGNENVEISSLASCAAGTRKPHVHVPVAGALVRCVNCAKRSLCELETQLTAFTP